MILTEIEKELKQIKPFLKKKLLPDIFTWKELESLINLRPFVNDRRFYFTGNNRYTWEAGGWLTDFNSLPPDKLQTIIDNNVCYLCDSSRANKRINIVCAELESIFNMPTDAHIYFNKKTNEMNYTGLGRHNDTQHNLIALARGSIKIKIWENDKDIVYSLDEGDVIFIPKGCDHQIISYTSRISVSFAISPQNTFFQGREWVTL